MIEAKNVRVSAEPALPVARLRVGRSGDVASVAQTLGVTLPGAHNAFTGDAELSCAWVEPRAWLVLGVARAALPDTTLPMALDLSDRYTSLRVQGLRAWDLLAAGTGIDRKALAPGRCAHTLFAEEIVVFLQCFSEGSDYRLLVDTPHAPFVTNWLRDALTTASARRPT